MKNLNLKIIMALHPTSKSLNNKDVEYSHLIYSIYITNTDYIIDYRSLTKRLRINNCAKMFIFDINPLNDKNESFNLTPDHISYSPVSPRNPFYILYIMNLIYFFKENVIKEILYSKHERFDTPIYRNTILIFNNIPLIFIIILFKINGIIITQGREKNRGYLSTVHLRTAQFLTCLEGINDTTVFNSFHNYDKLAGQPLWDQNKLLTTINDYENLKLFFKTLEEWIQFKLQIPKENTTFELKKNEVIKNKLNQDITLDYNEFFEKFNFLKTDKESNTNINENINNIEENNQTKT